MRRAGPTAMPMGRFSPYPPDSAIDDARVTGPPGMRSTRRTTLVGVTRNLRQDPFPRRLNLMQTSARNQFVGTVVAVRRGAVNDEIELAIAGDQRIVATITRESTGNLGLTTGREAFALVKASSVILMVDGETTRLSTRNRLAGKVARVEPGAVNAEVIVDLPGGGTVAAIVTIESANRLGLQPGKPVTAIFKASSVILGATD
ncbi:MAG: TOBE domain-containing protein [Burkholderiaceae bacterium]|nr:TOBE domain-containing protein [Burkholderiaceae bacterium]